MQILVTAPVMDEHYYLQWGSICSMQAMLVQFQELNEVKVIDPAINEGRNHLTVQMVLYTRLVITESAISADLPVSCKGANTNGIIRVISCLHPSK